ncbi:MAG: PAAR-like domain-containing protein [Candidatus Electrothrix sp. YB6]
MVAIFPASTKGGGNCLGAPDVCLTPAPPAPPVPTPYPNSGMVNQAKKTSRKVKFSGKQAVTVKSYISRSMGDEAGVNKGVMSGMNMGKIAFKKGSAKVKAQGSRCIRLLSITGHNGSNANMPLGSVVVASQLNVKFSQ